MTTANEISCAELVEIITDYLEQMRQTIAALGKLREESIAPDAREALLETFRGWRG